MAEQLTLDLVINDKASAAAKKLSDSLQSAQNSANKIKDSLDFAKQKKTIDKVSPAWTKALQTVTKNAEKTKQTLDFSKELKRSHDALQKLERNPEQFRKLMKIREEIREHERNLGKPGWLGEGVEEFSHKLKSAFKAAVIAELFIKGFELAFDGIKDILGDAFGEGIKHEQDQLSLKLRFGAEGAKEISESAEKLAKVNQFTDDENRKMIADLMRMGFGAKAARTGVSFAADVAAQGGNAQETIGLMRTLKAKEGLSKKGLVSFAQQVGFSVPEFYKELGKELKISPDEAAKKLEQGGMIDPQLVINMLATKVAARSGGEVGGGARDMGKTFGERLRKLKSLPGEFLKHISDSPAWSALSDKMGEIFERLDPSSPNGMRILTSLEGVFTKILTFLGKILDPGAPEEFSKKIDDILNTFKQIPDVLNKIITTIEILGTVFAAAKIASMISSLGAAIGVAAGPLTLAVGAIGLAAAGIYTLVNAIKELGGVKYVLRDIKDAVTFNNKPAVAREENSNTARYRVLQAQNQKNLSINAPMNFTVNTTDPSHTQRSAGDMVRNHMSSVMEDAALQSGVYGGN